MQQDLKELKEGLNAVEKEIELTSDTPPNDIFKKHIIVFISLPPLLIINSYLLARF